MTSEVNANHNSDNHSSNNKKRVVLKPRKSNNNKDNEWSYKNCLYNNLKLKNCAIKTYSNKLYHLCQNNIDQSSHDGGFENHFGNNFCCSECIEDKMKMIPPYCHNLFDSEISEDEVVDKQVEQPNDKDEVVGEEVVQSNDEDKDVDEEVVQSNYVVEEDEDQSNEED